MLITVEGIDGSGKSTVCEALEEVYPEAVLTREPTTSWYGQAVRRSIATPDADPLAELFLYTADHADHLHRLIRPSLEAGKLVISDRYSDSRYAYQGTTLEGVLPEPMSFVRSVHEPWTREPDLTIYLDVPPAVGAARSEGANKFEHKSHLRAVRDRYETLLAAEPDRFVRVDATRSSSSVITSVERRLEEWLGT